MIDNSVDYRGFKVDKIALECDKKMVDEFIDKLYQPERLNPEDILYVCDSPNSENKESPRSKQK